MREAGRASLAQYAILTSICPLAILGFHCNPPVLFSILLNCPFNLNNYFPKEHSALDYKNKATFTVRNEY